MGVVCGNPTQQTLTLNVSTDKCRNWVAITFGLQ